MAEVWKQKAMWRKEQASHSGLKEAQSNTLGVPMESIWIPHQGNLTLGLSSFSHVIFEKSRRATGTPPLQELLSYGSIPGPYPDTIQLEAIPAQKLAL